MSLKRGSCRGEGAVQADWEPPMGRQNAATSPWGASATPLNSCLLGAALCPALTLCCRILLCARLAL